MSLWVAAALLTSLGLPVDAQVITTVAGSGTRGFSGDNGPATSANLWNPSGVAVDAGGNLYIADHLNGRIRKVTPAGVITTFAGTGIFGFSGDNGPASSANLNDPIGVAVDASGNLYIADKDNNRIRRVTPAGVITTVAGSGTHDFSGDNGPATSASFRYPMGVAIDASGNLYIADMFNHRIRKVTPAGVITTVAGSGTFGFSGDNGPATSANLNVPSGVAVDAGGNLYITDQYNHRIRMVTSAGVITTVAGTGTADFSGDNGPATSANLVSPTGVAVDASGNLYIASGTRIRKVTPAGVITTVAGTGTGGFSGDNGPATSASLSPYGVAVDAGGNLYIADLGNQRIRKVTFGARSDFNGDGKSDLLWRNSLTGQVYRMLMNGFTISNGAMAYTEPNTAWKIISDADFNGDGVTDLLWRNDATGQVFVMPFNSSGLPNGGAFVTTEPNAAWKIVHTPDLDGDSKADILWWNSRTGQVYAMLMNGTTITSQGFVYTEPNTAWKIVAVGDLAGSGRQNQLLWRNSSTGQVFLMTVSVSGGAFSQSGLMIYEEPNTAWKIIGAADFNGDGRSDILWRNDSTGQVYMMLMNGGAIASQAMVYQETNLAWKVVAQGNYNGDGKADLLYRNDSTGQVYMVLMNGLAIASQSMIYQEANTAWQVLGPWEYGQ